jgi:tRNA A-37 threonylcarbamoyl transferase component Bud32
VIRREYLDTVEGAFRYGGGEELVKANLGTRQRMRITLTDETGETHVLYMKRYGKQTWRERLTARLTYGRRISQAAVELANIDAMGQIGIRTMTPVMCGQELGVTGSRRSFLLVREVPGEALERCFEEFLARHAERADVIEAFTRHLAQLVARLHAAGNVHRDLYASHIFLHEGEQGAALYLIDLARMFQPQRRLFRWRVKDVAQLKYSMPPQWVDAQWNAFMDAYLGNQTDLPSQFDSAVDKKVAFMAGRAERQAARGKAKIKLAAQGRRR